VRQLVPPVILENYIKGKFNGEFSAVGLFVDISGFSAITDTLMQHGQHGAEVLARIMRRIFGPLSQNIFEQGGFIVGYAGDALTALFPAEADESANARRAVAAAWGIQQQMAVEPQHVTEYGTFPISAKVGVASGEAVWGILRSRDERWATYFFRGAAVNLPARAEHQARAREIILSSEVYESVWNLVSAEPLEEFYRLTGLTGALPASQPVGEPPETFTGAMSAFSSEELLYQDLRSEFRQAVNLFISLPELSDSALKTFGELVFDLQEKYGGLFTRVDFGDKGCNILLFWGAPVAYENDIERALNFILDLRARTDFQFTAGLTYYISRAGFMGSDLMEEFTCYGWGINLAARFMINAPKGAVWLDERVAKRAGRRFEVDFIGEQRFKGFARLQKVFALTGRKDEAAQDYEGAMIGRELELQTLTDFVAPLWQGQAAGSLTIWGDPGMGKSRLVYEFQISALFRVRAALWALCQSDQILRESFNPLRYWLRRYFNVSNTQEATRNQSNFDVHLDGLIDATADKTLANELDRTRAFLAALVDLHWPDSPYEQMDARSRYDNTFIALTALIQAESLRQPVILFLEDAQYLDSDSNAFVRSLSLALKADPCYPVAILATSRRAGTALPLDQWLLDKELDLSGLPASSLAQLAETILTGLADAGLLRLLEERADGNPFFAEQILRYLHEESLLVWSENGWKVAEDRPEATLSTDIKVILVARLDQLTREARHVIQTASVLGREFEVQVLAYMLREDRSLGQKIAEAEKAAIWRAMTEIRYIFKHALLRDTAYTMQMQARRLELHALALESLKLVYEKAIESRYGELAYHAEQAQLTEDARRYLELAGDYAHNAYQNNAAADYYARALAIAPDDEARYRLRVALDDVYDQLGDRPAQRANLDEMGHLAAVPLAEVARLEANYLGSTGEYRRSIQKAREAIALAQPIGAAELAARAYFHVLDGLYRMADYAAMTEPAEAGIRLAREANFASGEALLLNIYGLAALAQGDASAARARFEQSQQLYQKAGNLRGQVSPFANLGKAADFQADYVAAQAYYEKALETARAVGHRALQSMQLLNLGYVLGLLGDYAAASGYLERGLRLARETGHRASELYAALNLSANAEILGEYQAALQYAQQSLQLANETGDRAGEAWAQTYLGHSLLALGHLPQSRSAYQRALDLHTSMKQPALATEPLAGLARVALELGDPAAAQPHISTILAHLEGGGSLDGTDQPLRVYLTCYLCLREADEKRAASILETAHQVLMTRVETIQAQALKHAFLENIPYHRNILRAWEASRGHAAD
jgi:class 3 adenylate cyclase/tetratricopeptide (TPR) repeat protein